MIETIAICLAVILLVTAIVLFSIVVVASPANAWTKADLYNGSVMWGPVKPPSGTRATICFGGGCAGTKRINFSGRLSVEIAKTFGEPAETAEEEREAISRTVDRTYRLLKPYLKPKSDADEVDEDVKMRLGFQHQNWECKTHAQNVSAVVLQMQRLGLLKHYKVGPHAYSSGHFFATLIGLDGAYWQLDTFFGATIFSVSPGCVKHQAVCIRRLG